MTTYFKIEEFLVTNTGKDNTPTDEHLKNLKNTMERMHSVRVALGVPVIVTSGYRSEAVNKAVGGSKTSAHTLGYAVDFVTRYDPTEACNILLKAGVKFDQLIAEYKKNSAWVHISFDPRMRQQVLTYKDGKYTEGLDS